MLMSEKLEMVSNVVPALFLPLWGRPASSSMIRRAKLFILNHTNKTTPESLRACPFGGSDGLRNRDKGKFITIFVFLFLQSSFKKK
jgi:hypothetical protein